MHDKQTVQIKNRARFHMTKSLFFERVRKCEQLTCISHTNSFASIALTEFYPDLLNSTPLAEPDKVTIASHCKGTSTLAGATYESDWAVRAENASRR
jgi:hypothetical protein